MTAARRSPIASRPDRIGARRDAGRRGGRRHRQDDRARRAHGARRSPRAARDGRARGRDLHREGGGRAEAAAAAGAREGAGRRRRWRPAEQTALEARAPQSRRGADRHHPRLLRRPAERAPGRGRRRSALRRADRRAGAPALRRSVRRVVPGRARGDARGRAPLAAAIEPARRRRRGRRRRSGRAAALGRLEPGRMARLSRVLDAARRSRGRPRSIGSRPACSSSPQIIAQGDEPARPAVPRHGAGAARQRRAAAADRRRAISTAAESLLVDLCRDRDFRRARKGYGPSFAKEFSRAATYEAHQELVLQLDIFKRDADADLAALLRDELRGSLDRYRRPEDAARRARLLRSAASRARSGARPRRRARGAPGAVRAHLRGRVPGHRSAAGRAAAPADGGRPARTRLDARAARGGEAVHRRRPEAVDLPVPPRRRARLPRRVPPAARPWGPAPDAERPASAAPRTCSARSTPALPSAMVEDADTLQAGYVPLAPDRAADESQPSVVALPVPKPYGKRNVSAMADREVAARRGRRLRRLAGARERLEGDRPGSRRGRRCRCSRGTSASCSAGS